MKLDEKYFVERLNEIYKSHHFGNDISTLKQLARDAAEEQRGKCFLSRGCSIHGCDKCSAKLDFNE
jgi:hypothetical protein